MPLATPTPPPFTGNQDHVNVDSDDDTSVARTKLKLNWTQEEDVRLKAEKYWGDVATEYNKTTPQNRWRSPKQAKERWHKLNTRTDLFQGCWLKAKRTYTSGYSDQMWIDMAHKFNEADNKKLGWFVLIDVWYACRDQPKWNAYNDALKRDLKGSRLITDVEETPRPIGQKAAKRAARESKGKSNDISDAEEIYKLDQVQSDIHTRRMKMMEMQEKLSSRQVQSSKLSQLAARENRLATKETKCLHPNLAPRI
ncbi:hypothetical protein DAI22_07g113200 [Oryza sativa Japonica Group]|nr:hypothetical protein DAI22_07g113200 [Oryza sativa Japonica Group]